MLQRKAYDRLVEWKEHGRKPLLVYGQRQVGKTYLIRRFAEDNFKNVVYADLSRDEDLRSVFNGKYPSVESVILSIRTLRSIVDCDPGELLIILDEVQDCDGALSSLKIFAEDGRYKVIASGSMSGVTLHPEGADGLEPLSPMGYVEPYLMRSLDFEEFLWSQGVPEESIASVRNCVSKRSEIPDAIYSRFSDLFRIYMIVGGMPAAVSAYNDDRETFVKAFGEMDSILVQVRKDINRYNKGLEAVKTAECFEAIPSQLAQSNKRYHYSRVDGGTAGSRRSADKYMGSLLWIKDAGYGNFVYSLNQIKSPLAAQAKRDLFKVYVSDTGMLTHMYGNPAVVALYSGDNSFNFGALTENIVAEALRKCGFTPYYYQNNNGDRRMEMDFVVEFVSGPVAVEVKSGKDRTAPSLGKVDEYFHVESKVMLETSNIYTDGKGVLHMPLFASAFFDSLDELPPYLK